MSKRYEGFTRVEVILRDEDYERLKAMVGGYGLSTVIKQLVADYLAQGPVLRAIEEQHRVVDGLRDTSWMGER